MAKLFKTISLEDRWKGSTYSEGPILPQAIKDVQTASLKITPEALKMNSELLKQSSGTKAVKVLPTIIPFTTQPISKLAIPFTNTKFRSAISLVDRLKQPTLGTTAHLPQYFLADQYTDYIKIKPTTVFEHTSTIVIQSPSTITNQGNITISSPNATPAQGGLNPVIPTFNSTTAQGIIFSNGLFSSVINITVPSYNSLLLQGVYQQGSNYVSVANITLTPQSVFQGPGTDPTMPISQYSVTILQGLVFGQSNELVSPINPAIPVTIPIVVPASITITNPIATPIQGGVNPTPITFEPNRTAPILNVLRYAADRALAFFVPKVKHGSANINGTQFASSFIPNQGTTPPPKNGNFNSEFSRFNQVSPLLNGILGVDGDRLNNVLRSLLGSDYDLVKAAYNDNNQKSPKYLSIQYVNGDRTLNPNVIFAKALGATTPTDRLGTFVLEQVQFPKPINGEGSISNYKTLSYDQIRARANSSSQQRPDFRKTLGIVVKDGASVNVRGVTRGDQEYANDLISLRVTSMRDNSTINFRAFITNFSDSFNMTWSDINYVGRQDTIKTFKGVTRGASVGFKVAALYESDMAINYGKLNRLVKMAAVGSSNVDGKYIVGPLCKITMGKWFTNTPCVFNSIKFDIQTAEYSWDIDKQMPHLVDVSLDFAILGDITGKPMDSANNDYFTYRG
jgi:hypothetical protein